MIYPGAQAGGIGNLLRLIQEEKTRGLGGQLPSAQMGSPVREVTQQPLMGVEAPGSARRISLRPEEPLPTMQTPAPTSQPPPTTTGALPPPVAPFVPSPPAPLPEGATRLDEIERGNRGEPGRWNETTGRINPTTPPIPTPYQQPSIGTRITSGGQVKGATTVSGPGGAYPIAGGYRGPTYTVPKPKPSPTPTPRPSVKPVPLATAQPIPGKVPTRGRGQPIVENPWVKYISNLFGRWT